MTTGNDFFLQKRAAGSPNNGTIAFQFGCEVTGHVNAEPFVTTPEDIGVQAVILKRVAGSPNCGLMAYQFAMDDYATPAVLMRGDNFGNVVSNQKERGGL